YINIVSQKIRLLLAGSSNWDYQYLRNMLSRSRWAELHDQILPEGTAGLKLPPDQILAEDVAILSDVQPESLSAEQRQALVKLVNERGGSVIIVPGDAKQVAAMVQLPGLGKLLPFSNPQTAS